MRFYTIRVTTEEEATRICQELNERGFSEKTDAKWFKAFENTTCDVRVSVVFMWMVRL